MDDLLTVYFFHWLPSKAIWIGGHTLPWDARCSGIYIGFGTGTCYRILVEIRTRQFPPWPILIAVTWMFLPLLLDVLSIMGGMRTPSNNVRYFTGIFFGCALSVYLYPAIIVLGFPRGIDKPAIGSWRSFGALFVLLLATYVLKEWDAIISFAVLETLAILGAVSLFVILAFGMFKVVTSSRSQRHTC